MNCPESLVMTRFFKKSIVPADLLGLWNLNKSATWRIVVTNSVKGSEGLGIKIRIDHAPWIEAQNVAFT
jgi:hypothetical protein